MTEEPQTHPAATETAPREDASQAQPNILRAHVCLASAPDSPFRRGSSRSPARSHHLGQL